MNYQFRNVQTVATAIGLLALVGAMPAYAADAVMEEPPAPAAPMIDPPVASWTGGYVGLTGGYAFAGRTEDQAVPNTINTDGFLFGGFAGYNYQFGNVVAGAEGDVGYSWESGSNAGEALGLRPRRFATRPSRLRRIACRASLRYGRWRSQGS